MMTLKPDLPKRAKASITLCTIVVMTLLVIVGCGQRKREGGRRQAEASITVAINAGEEGKAIAAMAKSYPALRVNIVELPYTDLREKLTLTLGSQRQTYDVIMIDDPWFPELSTNLAPLGQIPDSLLADIIPSCLSLCRSPYPSGQIKALPFVGNCQLLFFRRDLLTLARMTQAPRTWKEVIQASKLIARAKPTVAGYCIRGKSGAPVVSDFLPVLWSFGADVYDDRGSPTRVTIDSPKTIEAITTYLDLAHASPKGAEAFDWTEMTAVFTAGNAAMELNWPAAIATIDTTIPRSSNGSRNWGVALPPGSEEGSGTSMAGNWLLGVPNGSSKKSEGTAFIIWLLEHQEEAAMLGTPPTRMSVYSALAIRDTSRFFFYPILQAALARSTPRPRLANWSQAEDVISAHISGALVGRETPERAMHSMAAELMKTLQSPNH